MFKVIQVCSGLFGVARCRSSFLRGVQCSSWLCRFVKGSFGSHINKKRIGHFKKTQRKKICTLLDLCVSSLRRGHANLLCIVPILTDVPRRESKLSQVVLGAKVYLDIGSGCMYDCVAQGHWRGTPLAAFGAYRPRPPTKCVCAKKGLRGRSSPEVYLEPKWLR